MDRNIDRKECFMIPQAQLIQSFTSNHWLACRLLDGISQVESLETPPFNANSINWLLGHILAGRVSALAAVDAPSFWSDDERVLYQTGSNPTTLEYPGLPFDKLLADFNRSQEMLQENIESKSAEFLQQEIDTPRGRRPRWQELSGLAWHETYHVGQFELLRQMVHDSRVE